MSGSFTDYLLPSTCEIIKPTIIHIETPSPFTPLGAKGLGEGNCMSTPVAIANAASDALGVENITLPLTHSKIYTYLANHKKEKQRSKSNFPKKLITDVDENHLINGRGSKSINMNYELVWDNILDPETLIRVLPGSKDIQIKEPHLYTGEININFGPITGKYDFLVQLTDLVKPISFKLKGSATGSLGSATGKGKITLMKTKKSKTILDYYYEVEVSGKIAAIGNRFLNVAAKIILNQVLNQLTKEISPKNKKLSFLALLINFFGPRQ